MTSQLNPDVRLELGKDKIRGFYQEREAARLAQQARSGQPDQIKAALNHAFNFFKHLTLKKPLGLKRMAQDKPLVRHDLPI